MSKLVLSRKVGESVLLAGGEIKVTVIRMNGGTVRLLFEVPPDIPIVREEIAEVPVAT